uniref:Uncharacterized protein n=1 Tax=Solanum tuberosum TaxID=4113 RepID=M1AKL1_SOLTU
MKKRRPEDRLNHLASRRMSMSSPNAPNVISPKVTELEDAEGQSKTATNMTKGRIAEWIGDPDLLRRLVLRSDFVQ